MQMHPFPAPIGNNFERPVNVGQLVTHLVDREEVQHGPILQLAGKGSECSVLNYAPVTVLYAQFLRPCLLLLPCLGKIAP